MSLAQDDKRLMPRVKFLAMTGIGFFADGYLNVSIGLVVPMLGYIYFTEDGVGPLKTTESDLIKGSLSLGMILGQIAFGILGDTLGRHRIYGTELIATIFGTLMCILLPWKGLSHEGIVAWMCVWRMFTGLGIGGDYPMSAAVSAERTPLGSRAILVLSAFSCVGFGTFASSVVYLVLLAAFKGSIQHDVQRVEWVWRLLMGIGLLPCLATVYARFRLGESKPFEKYVLKDASGNIKNKTRTLKDQFCEAREYFSDLKHLRTLAFVSIIWFLFDIAYYGINLNQSIILTRIGYAKAPTPFETLWNTAVGNMIIQASGYLPGWIVGIFLPDLIGRQRQQLYCCAGVAILYAVWAGVTGHTGTGGLMTVFSLSHFILNAGPAISTFILPVELFPTRVRATAHGIAAATGKAGAVLTAFTFGTVTEAIGIHGVLGLLAGIMAVCALLTLWVPETRGTTIEDIETDKLYGGSFSETPTIEEQSTAVIQKD